MVDPEKISSAMAAFCENPQWKDIFFNAPPGAQERLAVLFYFSHNKDSFQAEDFEEYRNLREEIEASLGQEDLEYLVEVLDKPETKAHYQQLLDRLLQQGGQPTGVLKFKEWGKAQAPAGAGEQWVAPGEGTEQVQAVESVQSEQ